MTSPKVVSATLALLFSTVLVGCSTSPTNNSQPATQALEVSATRPAQKIAQKEQQKPERKDQDIQTTEAEEKGTSRQMAEPEEQLSEHSDYRLNLLAAPIKDSDVKPELITEAELELRRQQVELAKAVEHKMQLRWEAGVSSLLELETTKVALIDYKIRLMQAEQAWENSL